MARTFKINGTSLTYIVDAQWNERPAGTQYHAGPVPFNRWRGVTLFTEGMTATEFDTLYALEGQRVTTTLPPYNDRNASDYVTYYAAEIRSVSAEHQGPTMGGVTLEMMVRV